MEEAIVVDLPPIMGEAQPLFVGHLGKRLDGWATFPASASWNEQGDGEHILGLSGQLYYEQPARHWHLQTSLRAENREIDEIAVGARLADQRMIAITVRNVGILLVDVQTIDAEGNQLQGHLEAPIQADLSQLTSGAFEVSHIGDELRLKIADIVDHGIALSEPSSPAYWVNNRDPSAIIAIDAGSTLAQEISPGE